MVHSAIPSATEHPNLLNGLVAKRAEIAGRIEANEADHRRLTAELGTLDATIRIFEPDVDFSAIPLSPVPPREAAQRGEVTRIVFDVLREATRPLTAPEIAEVVMRERGLPSTDPDLVSLIRKRVRACLLAKKGQGFVRSIKTSDPLLSWEMIR